jgi:hypothetical protein
MKMTLVPEKENGAMKKQVQPQRGTKMHKEGVEPLITDETDNRKKSRFSWFE